MKKKMFYAWAGILFLTGCSDNPSLDEVIPQTNLIPIQFSIQMEKEIVSFPQTKSIPDNTIPEPAVSSKAEGDAELSDLCSTIEYVVYKDESGVPVLAKHRQYIYDPLDLDADFGCIYDSLPQGNYTCYFLAHNSGTAQLSGSTFSFDELSDTFYGALSLEIDVAEEINNDITLQRVVSRIEFMATDPVTADLKQFDMEIKGRSVQLDLTSGSGIQSEKQETFSHTFTSEEIGTENKVHSFYTFVPSGDYTLAAHLSAISQNDELIRERQVDNITPQKNKIIRYKGRLYSRSESDDTFLISIYNNGKWEEQEETLPEYE